MFALLPLSLALAAPVPKDLRPLRNADPPKAWKADDLAAAFPWPEAGTVHVLAWEVIDTKRGYTLEAALVVKALNPTGDEGNNFVLAYLLRVPKAEDAAWRFATVCRTEVKPNGVPVIVTTQGFRFTEKPPTDGQVAKLLAEMRWGDALKADADRTPELKAGGVVYANWKAVLNRDPPAELFPELKAK